MNIKLRQLLLIISTAFLIAPVAYAETPQPTAEQIKLAKDQVKYKTYIPKSYVLFEAVEGDLNKDGKSDAVLIIKGTDPKQWVDHEYHGKLDRNRRGIIILLNQGAKNQQTQYIKYLQNLDCFSSENEEGGVYFAPELWVEIDKGILDIHYGHGRYGYWRYLFRLQDQDMRLIGYDDSNNFGPYIKSETSINFLTGRKVYRKNMNETVDDDADPKFKETWQSFDLEPIYLSQIKDFDEIDFGIPDMEN